MTASMTSGPTADRGSPLIVALCGTLILFDGYDLVVYGNIVPSLLAEPGWHLTPVTAGRIASFTLAGMAVGAVLAGSLADRFGRRTVILASLALFSVCMAASAAAPGPAELELARAAAGLGLGAMFPSATAMIIEFAPPHRQALSYTLAFFGYQIGGILAALFGLALIGPVGWRPMLAIGAAPLLALPVLYRVLPESPRWLLARGRRREAHTVAARFAIPLPAQDPQAARPEGVRSEAVRTEAVRPEAVILSAGYRRSTVMFWGLAFCSLLLVGGMVTWLPTMMKGLGYSLDSALLFSLVLNVGATLGAYLAARYADRHAGRNGPRTAVVSLLFVGACGMLGLTTAPALAPALLLIAAAGAGSLGAQILVNTFGSGLYPPAVRATGVGWALGVGRIGAIIGPVVFGAILTGSFGAAGILCVLALAGTVGGLIAALIPPTPALRAGTTPSGTFSEAHS